MTDAVEEKEGKRIKYLKKEQKKTYGQSVVMANIPSEPIVLSDHFESLSVSIFPSL